MISRKYLYNYHRKGGFWSIILSSIFSIISIIFTIVISFILFACIKWHDLYNCNKTETLKQIVNNKDNSTTQYKEMLCDLNGFFRTRSEIFNTNNTNKNHMIFSIYSTYIILSRIKYMS